MGRVGEDNSLQHKVQQLLAAVAAADRRKMIYESQKISNNHLTYSWPNFLSPP